jgi:hypothetical protein
MKKQILEELNDIKYLFNYNRGKVISEQEQFEAEEIDFEEIDINDEDDDEDINYLKGEFNEEYSESYEEMDVDYYDDDMEVDEEIIEDKGVEVPVKPGIKTPTKPKKPGTPYSPKPGPKPDPKAKKRKGDMPNWLTFDELGIDFE